MRIIIKIILRTRKRNRYFFYKLYAETHRVCGRRNTRKFLRRANRNVRERRKGMKRRNQGIFLNLINGRVSGFFIRRDVGERKDKRI